MMEVASVSTDCASPGFSGESSTSTPLWCVTMPFQRSTSISPWRCRTSTKLNWPFIYGSGGRSLGWGPTGWAAAGWASNSKPGMAGSSRSQGVPADGGTRIGWLTVGVYRRLGRLAGGAGPRPAGPGSALVSGRPPRDAPALDS